MTSPKTPEEAIRLAIQSEMEGHHFYRMAAQTTEDPAGRETFTRLAAEELEHARVLSAWAERLAQGAASESEPPALSQPSPPAEGFPIFSDAIRERLADAHFEMTALSVGVQLEASAEHFYAEAARITEEPTLRKLFSDLAAWENTHYRALLAQQEALKNDYWAAAGFAPF